MLIVFYLGVLTLVVGLVVRSRRRAAERPLRGAWLAMLVGATAIGAGVATDPAAQKIVGRLVMPLGVVWVGLAVAAAGTALHGRRKPALGLFALWVLLTLAGNGPLGQALLARLESQVPPVTPGQGAPFDAICVLGGGTGQTPDGRAQFGGSGDRLGLALQFYRAGQTPILVSTGSTIAGVSRPRDLAAEARDLWMALGVPREAILTLPEARNTREEITALGRLMAERGWHRVGLVSSAWHLPRVLRQCARQGVAVVPLPADYQSAPEPWSGLSLIPQASGVAQVQAAVWEYVGAWVGR